MTPAAYLELARTEEQHWWYVARRAILTSILTDMRLPDRAAILEVGSGTSGNLDMLANFGRVSAVEMDSNARRISREKTGGRYDIRAGVCPDSLPFEGPTFDLICMFDVLEHIDRADESLTRLRGLLKPGGRMLIAVPAYQWLWGVHDEFLHHQRRYCGRSLRAQAERAGLIVDRMTHFNMFLFPLGALSRLVGRLFDLKSPKGTDTPPPPVNQLFTALMSSERHLLRHIDLPFGLSLLAILRAT